MRRLGMGHRLALGAGLVGLGVGLFAARAPRPVPVVEAVHAQEQAPGRREFQLTARRYEYAPPRIEVTQDDLVKITLTSADIPHSFTIEESPYRIMKRAEPGKPVSFDLRADQPGAHAGPQRGRDRHLAIRDVVARRRILPRHANRMAALFEECRIVEQQHAATLRHDRQQPTPDHGGVPGRMRDEVLEGLVGAGLGDPHQHRLHRLARAVAQQSVDVLAQRQLLSAMPETRFERLEPSCQPSKQRPLRLLQQRASRYQKRHICTMSKKQITSSDLTK